MLNNPDNEEDEIAERKAIVKAIYQKHGQNTRLILALANITKTSNQEAADAWTKAGVELEDTLHSTGKFYG